MVHSDVARDYLMERQRAEGVTGAEMARRLKMSRPNWSHVRRGNRALAAVQVLRACVLYPELRGILFQEAKAS
jgi:transcriptional regulator with XRE-family HTH domain